MDALSVEGLTKENALLKAELHDLTMRLAAIKTILTRVNPVCSQKLMKLLEECEGCEGDTGNM